LRYSNEPNHPRLVHHLRSGLPGARQDRVLALDTLYVNSMLLLLVFGIRTGKVIYFEAALVIGMLGFVATVALAKFLMRGEVIE
jgi:multicomponent K+:H+ antiporter subunit F